MNRSLVLVSGLLVGLLWHPVIININRSCLGAVQDESKLHSQIRKYEAVVLLFYDTSCRKNAKQTRRFQQVLTQLAQSGFYPAKALAFMSLDIAKSLTKQFMQDHGISAGQLPMLVLFKNGVLVEDQHGAVIFQDEPFRASVKKFIDDYLALDIAHHVREQRAFKRYKDVVRDRMHVYYTPYFSKIANPWNDWWGWPYYGMAQGNYGGNVGVNFFASNY